MNTALFVDGLCKEYPGFLLDRVSFSVPKGSITGFIGRNGAGKSTTLKASLNLVHADSGSISYFGMPLKEHENEIKQRIGFAGGAVSYYKKKKLSEIARITGRFYENWDSDAFGKYMRLFSIDPEKTPDKLSEGMRVKFSLALALSHRAELLILDEPTSGLDPVSREELLETFLMLREKGISVLFSTHITSDLDRCADRIVYIQKGRIIAESEIGEFTDSYRTVSSAGGFSANAEYILGKCKTRDGETGLISTENACAFEGSEIRVPTLEDIMVHLEKEDI